MKRPLTAFGLSMVTTMRLGLLRPAPGTWGSMPPVVLAALLIALGFGPRDGAMASAVYHGAMAAVFAVFFGACLIYADGAEAHFLKKDPGSVTADETACMALVLAWLPAATPAREDWVRTGAALVAAFLAFRVFDILKLWPARGLQKIPGGMGIFIDDLVAAVQAWVAVQVVFMMWSNL